MAAKRIHVSSQVSLVVIAVNRVNRENSFEQ